MVRNGAFDLIGSSGFEPAGTDASVGAKTRVSNVIREGLSVGSERDAENAKGRRRAALTSDSKTILTTSGRISYRWEAGPLGRAAARVSLHMLT
jgi:hypothetical protein